MHAMGKLALITILTGATLLKGPAQLCLIAVGVDLAAATHTCLTARPQPVHKLWEGALTETVLLVFGAAAATYPDRAITIKAVDKLVLAELYAGEADWVMALEQASCRGGPHHLPVQQGPGVGAGREAGIGTRDRRQLRSTKTAVVVQHLIVLWRQTSH